MDHATPPSARIGFLGTGLMGSPIASRLAASGLTVSVWNRTSSKVSDAVAAGARAHDRAVDAVWDAEIVFLCLTDQDAVEDVLFGANAIAPAVRPGMLIVDLSTIGPEPTRQFAARLAASSGSQWVDAPLTGGVAGAAAGTLIALVGGEPVHVERLAPILACFTRRINHMGPLGTGQAAKLCNQLIVTINIVAITEALAVAEANGIDPNLLPDALAGGWADSLPLQIIGKRMAAQQSEPKIAAVGTFAKDIRAALASAAHEKLPMTLTKSAAHIYAEALDAGLSEADITHFAARAKG